jgi:hypothetical protein
LTIFRSNNPELDDAGLNGPNIGSRTSEMVQNWSGRICIITRRSAVPGGAAGALAVVAGPALPLAGLLFDVLQRVFMKGITVGAVQG